MKRKFSIDLIGDVDFEGMVVEINFDHHVLARLNYDRGVDKIEVEFCPGAQTNIVFPLAEFSDVLERAKNILIKCYNEDQARKLDSN